MLRDKPLLHHGHVILEAGQVRPVVQAARRDVADVHVSALRGSTGVEEPRPAGKNLPVLDVNRQVNLSDRANRVLLRKTRVLPVEHRRHRSGILGRVNPDTPNRRVNRASVSGFGDGSRGSDRTLIKVSRDTGREAELRHDDTVTTGHVLRRHESAHWRGATLRVRKNRAVRSKIPVLVKVDAARPFERQRVVADSRRARECLWP